MLLVLLLPGGNKNFFINTYVLHWKVAFWSVLLYKLVGSWTSDVIRKMQATGLKELRRWLKMGWMQANASRGKQANASKQLQGNAGKCKQGQASRFTFSEMTAIDIAATALNTTNSLQYLVYHQPGSCFICRAVRLQYEKPSFGCNSTADHHMQSLESALSSTDPGTACQAFGQLEENRRRVQAIVQFWQIFCQPSSTSP